MSGIRLYEIDGMTLKIPIHYDEIADMYIEDYPDFIESPVWTPSGYRVLFSGTDACTYAEEKTSGGCPDCGSCKYYRRISHNTWIGVCEHSYQRKK